MSELDDCLGVVHIGWSSQHDPEIYRSSLLEYSYLEWILRRSTEFFGEVAVLVPEDTRFDYVYDQSIQWTNYVYRERERSIVYESILDHFDRFDQFAFLSGVSPFFSRRLIRRNLAKLGDRKWISFQGVPEGTDMILADRNCLKSLQSGGPSEFSIDTLKTFLNTTDTIHGESVSVGNWIHAPNYDLSVHDRDQLESLRSIVETVDENPEDLEVQDLLTRIDDLSLNQRTDSPFTAHQSGNVLYAFNVGGKSGLNSIYEFLSVLDGAGSTEGLKQIIGLIGSDEIDGLSYEDLEARTTTNFESRKHVTVDDRVSSRDILRWVSRLGANTVVIDRTGLNVGEVKKLSRKIPNIIGINEPEPVRSHLDAVIDPLQINNDWNRASDSDSGKFFGPDFAIVHPDSREIPQNPESNPVEDVGLFFELEDEFSSEKSFLKEVAPQFPEFSFHLPGGTHRDGLPDDIPINVEIVATFDPSPKSRDFDFTITSVGPFMFEAMATNTPAMVYTKETDEFEKCKSFFEKFEVKWPLLNDPDASEWARELQKAKKSENLDKARTSTRGVVDGKGCERFLQLLINSRRNRVGSR